MQVQSHSWIVSALQQHINMLLMASSSCIGYKMIIFTFCLAAWWSVIDGNQHDSSISHTSTWSHAQLEVPCCWEPKQHLTDFTPGLLQCRHFWESRGGVSTRIHCGCGAWDKQGRGEGLETATPPLSPPTLSTSLIHIRFVPILLIMFSTLHMNRDKAL